MEGNTPALLCKAGVFHRLSNRELDLLSVCLEFFFVTSVLNHTWPRVGNKASKIAGQSSHYTGFPPRALMDLSVFIAADLATRGCAISSVTLARVALLDVSLAFLFFFLARIQVSS
jgi:hypothetical protein